MTELTEKQQTIDIKCCGKFIDCSSTSRIKLVLDKYSNIISHKNHKTLNQLQHETNKLIHNTICNGYYSHVQLLNDFYHVKYDHKVNDDKNEFNLLHKYLLDDDNILNCDINDCEGVKRFYTGRNRSIMSTANNIEVDTDYNHQHSWNLISRIHIYFIHSHDTSQLTNDEIKYVESQLKQYKKNDQDISDDRKIELISIFMSNKPRKNSIMPAASDHNKFVTMNRQCMDYNTISTILQKYDILISKNDLTHAFDHYGYDRQQLFDDLCKALINGEKETILLQHILKSELEQDDENKRKLIYSILCYEYMMVNYNGFIKYLQMVASMFVPDINCSKISEIATSMHLTGNVFTKGSNEFKNSVHFGKIFKTMNGWDKKKWSKIYAFIKKRKPIKGTTAATHVSETKTKTDPKNVFVVTEANANYTDRDDIKYQENKYPEDTENAEDNANYTDRDDFEAIQEFCAITNASNEVAVKFLKKSQWNVYFAVNLLYDYEPNSSINSQNNKSIQLKEVIYNHGIAFWYWNKRKTDKIFVEARFQNLKEEILHFKGFTANQWECLIKECEVLAQTDAMKKITPNDNDLDIYEIDKEASIDIHHLCSVKLYTDYSWLCKIFCEAFRTKMI
eukprot:103978_1